MIGLTGEQIRAARAMLGWEQSELAERANISVKTIKRLEGTAGRIDARSEWAVKNALEFAGIEFVGEHDWRQRTDGVRFAKDRTARLRESIVEDVALTLSVDLKIASEEDPDFFERPPATVSEMVKQRMGDAVREKIEFHLNKRRQSDE